MSSKGIYASNFLSKYFNRSKNFECFDCKLISPKNYFIECQHCICQRCLSNNKYCSLCPNQRIKVDGDNPTAFQFILTEIILNPYLMKCVFNPCEWQGTYHDFIKVHYQECDFRKNRELYQEYFEEFSNGESEERNKRSKSEIKSVKKNVKNKYSLNNSSNDNSSDERDFNNSFYRRNKRDNNDKIKNMLAKRNKYEKIEKNNEIKPSKDDFEIYQDNFFSIKKGFICEKNNPKNFNNCLFGINKIVNNEEKSFEQQNNYKNYDLKEIVINIGDDGDENEEEEDDEKDEEEEEEESEEVEEEIDKRRQRQNRVDIEFEFEGGNSEVIPIVEEEEDEEDGKDEEDEDDNDNIGDKENNVEEEYIEFVEKDTSKETYLKDYEIEEIESEDNSQDEDYEQEEIEELNEDDESEEEEKIKRKRKIKYQKRKNMVKSNNYNYLNRKRKKYPINDDYFNEYNDNYADNNYININGYKNKIYKRYENGRYNNYKRRKIQY